MEEMPKEKLPEEEILEKEVPEKRLSEERLPVEKISTEKLSVPELPDERIPEEIKREDDEKLEKRVEKKDEAVQTDDDIDESSSDSIYSYSMYIIFNKIVASSNSCKTFPSNKLIYSSLSR